MKGRFSNFTTDLLLYCSLENDPGHRLIRSVAYVTREGDCYSEDWKFVRGETTGVARKFGGDPQHSGTPSEAGDCGCCGNTS